MTICSPFVVALTTLEESVLSARARAGRSQHRDVIRARIVLAAAAGAANEGIAAEVGIHVDTVRKWRRRFTERGLPGLDDLPRCGRPHSFTPVQVAQVKALACTLPAETGLPLSRWSGAELADEVVTRGLAEAISPATVRRWLARRRDQAVAAPILDLPPRPRLRDQGHPGAGPVRPALGR